MGALIGALTGAAGVAGGAERADGGHGDAEGRVGRHADQAIHGLGARGGHLVGHAAERAHSGGDGRLKRASYEALQRIAEGRTGDDALAALRRDLEGLHEENRALRDRLGRLETSAPAKAEPQR